MKNFQIVMLIIFLAGAVLGILVFAGYINIGNKNEEQTFKGTVVVWGTYSSRDVNLVLKKITSNLSYKIKYIYKNEDTFEKDLIEAMALGKAPDLFFVNNDFVYKFLNKIYIIPYTTYPLINYQNTFAEGTDVFLTSKGIIALPVSIDPLLFYYNKDVLNSNGISFPPEYLDDFNNFNPLIKKNSDNQIIQSTFALGQASNISHSKEIISNLFMQTGNKIIYKNEVDYFLGVMDSSSLKNNPLTPMLDFFISFSNPLNDNYSWNKSMPLSIDAFAKESLIFYFGFASDLPIILKKNPNLNFQITKMPQIKNSKNKIVYSKIYGIAISSTTKNLNGALQASVLLSSSPFVDNLIKINNTAPAMRNLLAKPDLNNQYTPTLYSSALYSRSYLDPLYNETNVLFENMVENVLSNKMKSEEAILNTNTRINNLLN